MIRDSKVSRNYWNKFIDFEMSWMKESKETLLSPSNNPDYRPEFTFEISRTCLSTVLRRYSRGDDVGCLRVHVADAIEMWEMSNKISENFLIEIGVNASRNWVFQLANLNHYNWCFWLVGLALALEVPDEQWHRLLVLIGDGGEDELLDRIIASRDKGRCVGASLLHPRPYGRLLKVINAEKEQQAFLLKKFVDNWYIELARKGDKRVWWYFYGDPEIDPLERGYYFGRWCLEAVAAVKAFGLDDSQCLGHEHYPGDLLRPAGPTTHPQPQKDRKIGWISRMVEPVNDFFHKGRNFRR